MPVSNRGGGGGGAPGGNGGNRAARGPVAPPVRTATPPPSFADETTATPVRRIDVDAADSDSPFRRGGGGGGVHRVTAAADAADALPCVEGIEVAEVAEEDEEAATGSGGDDEAEGGDGGCEGCVENIILRFPTEQVEELISCLISHLVEQGLSEREASERAADILDDPDAQLVMAKELHKPVLARLLADFYARHDRDALRGLDREVAAFTGRTRDLLAVLRRRYRLNESALDDLALRLGAVVDEESEWAAATAERSGTGYTSRSGSGGGAGGEAAAAAAAAAATRRFLVGFFSKHDQERVLEADSLLRAYDGCAAALRRDLCGRYAASRGALRDLARMKVERPGAPSTGRELWLAANARRAAGGSRGVAAAVDAVGLSSGFRRYALFWGVAAAALLVACAAQQSLALLLAAFAPEQGRWQSAGLVCCFVAGVFVVGSLLGHVRGVLAEWAGLTPAEYYGDADLSGADGGNPVPPHLRPVLPPCVRRTFLRLPTCAWVPRHAYMAAAQAALLVVPLVGGVVRTAAEGGSVFQFLGTVSEWSVAAATAGLLLLWVHGWANALALKASRLRAPRGGGGAWYANGGVLAEFGLDARSTGRSLLVLAAAAALLLVPFWVNTQTSSDMPLAWVLVCAAVVGGVLGLREMRAAGPAVARYTPLCAAGFVAAFAVLGVAGTAQTGAATVGVFACLMVASQGMFLVHEDKAEETRTAIECAAERMHSVSEEDVEINDATPLRPTKQPRLPFDSTSPARDSADAPGSSKISSASWLPGHALLRTLFSFPCGGLSPPPPQPPLSRALPHWRTGGRPASAATASARTGRARTAAFSPRCYLAFLLLLFVCTVGMFRAPRALRSPADGGAAAGAAAASTRQAAPALPVCAVSFGQLDVVDLVLLTKLSYAASQQAYDADFAAWFADGRVVAAADGGGFAAASASDPAVRVARYAAAGNHSVLVLGAGLEDGALARSLQEWSASLLHAALSTGVPVVSWWSDAAAERFVSALDGLAAAYGAAGPSLEAARGAAEAAVQASRRVTIVGHGVAGGYARVLAGEVAGAEAAVFNAPGSRLLGKRRAAREVVVAADREVMAGVGGQTGAVQVLRCAESLSPAECGHVQHTVCALLAACGDTSAADFC